MRTIPVFIAAVTFLSPAFLTAQQGRLSRDDRNGDGVVTRDEWRGTSRAFSRYDRNGDGIISQEEMPGQGTRSRTRSNAGRLDQNRSGAVEQYEWPYNPGVFEQLDRNRDGALVSRELEDISSVAIDKLDQNRNRRIDSNEWPGGFAEFRDLDQNGDGRISPREYYEQGNDWQRRTRSSASGANSTTADRLDKNASGRVEGYEWPYNRELFHQLDTNGDSTLSQDELRNMTRATLAQVDKNRNGRIEEQEWPGGFADFQQLDENRDGRVSANEYFERGGEWQQQQRFRAWDTNRDGIIQSTEWKSDNDLFHRLDTNANSQIEWDEFRSRDTYRSRRY
jgi:Ca2+-binding EF-hand superfamily protein